MKILRILGTVSLGLVVLEISGLLMWGLSTQPVPEDGFWLGRVAYEIISSIA